MKTATSSHFSRVEGIILILVVLVFVVAGYFYLTQQHQAPAKQIATIQPAIETPSPEPQPPALVDHSANLVHKGQGKESPIIRQLVADPMIAADQKGLAFTGDLNDKAAVKYWAGRVAHILMTRAGEYDWRFHMDMGVKTPDTVAYELEKNDKGKLTVAVYQVTKPANPDSQAAGPVQFSKVAVDTIAPTIAASHFLGDPGMKIPSYEYVRIPS